MAAIYRINTSKYSMNDYFSWNLYEKLPKTSGDTDIFFLANNIATMRR